MMAYVPQQVPCYDMTLRDLYARILQLKVNAAGPYDELSIQNNMELVGIDKSLINKNINSLDKETVQLAMLAVLPLLKKKIILLDHLPQTTVVSQWMSNLTSMGSEVIYTCETNQMQCHKIINI